MENHLGYELVSGKPAAGANGADVLKRLAEAVICYVGTHVGVDI